METIEVLPIRLRVAAILRKALLAGEFKAGEELSLTDTAASMGVSRTPVREAFQALAAEGLLELRMNRGAVVIGVDEKFIRNHFHLRRLLESEAVRCACNNGCDLSKVDALQQWAESHLGTMSEEEYRKYNQRLHMEFWQGADNQKLYELLSSLWNGPSGANAGRDEAHEALSIREHRQMIDHMHNHDPEAAASVMTQHIDRSMNNILRQFQGAKAE